MFNRFASIGLPVLVLSLMVGCGTTDNRTDESQGFQGAQAVTIAEQVHGNDAALDRPTLELIRDSETLDALGVEALTNLDVNFDEQDVIVFALGEQPTGGYWAHITGVQQVGNVLYVEGQANRPGEDEAATQALTYPYAAAVINKTGAATTFSDIESVQGQPQPE